MLFDLRGKRRRLIQVIYGSLALLMGGGLVLFGIGGEVSGGLLDGLGVGGGGANSRSADFDEQADRLERRAQQNPRNAQLQLQIARTRYLAGNADAERDENNQVTAYTDESVAQFEQAAVAWERYVKLADEPNPNVAIFMATSYAVLNDAKGAAAAQTIVADDRPSPTTYFELARYRYFADDFEGGDRARDRAAELAERQQKGQGAEIRKALNEARKQARTYLRQQRQARTTGADSQPNPFQNPLSGGGLGGGAGAPATP